MFNNILVVCAGNICRSPTGEYLLKDKLKEKLGGESHIKISSAGLTALVGNSAEATATSIALSNNIDMSGHKGRQLSSALIAENDLILVMEERHLSDLLGKYPQARGKTFLLGKWIDNTEIPDPYRQSQEAFEHVYQLVDKACSAWTKYL
ncbi:low molecular weight protein-tyrosine-phosphatase [Colwellia hornerae]|uniref:protein-tyrosine-phosphatase n=1 Tax=Colwellia hornerae TaxID=89402 RepID=A0A5C6QKJ9_9GAMM|nr:low molecular weight protein-tyrosine-phosphatase [Colwellia hornerae]TWX54169.1 low molecular weight phosphotyrosine protein phosphatase [Colwellia hornerae]TWX60944.1 low molecular weight phosphotyrosine protein phosphatase [Colwellia hornerae]TWX69243.1 low molecular weight phosphotyrosine protein phosphatase [Colwellia hornerae]